MSMIDVLRASTDFDAFEVVDSRSATVDHCNAELRAREVPDLLLSVAKDSGDARVWIINRMTVPVEISRFASESPDGVTRLRQFLGTIEEQRPGTITCSLLQDNGASTVEMRALIYEDGFTRHALNCAILEIARLRQTLARRFQAAIEAAQSGARVKQLRKERRETYAEANQELHPTANQSKDALPTMTSRSAISNRQEHSEADPPALSEVRCPNQMCGRVVRPGEKFCSNCGTRVK